MPPKKGKGGKAKATGESEQVAREQAELQALRLLETEAEALQKAENERRDREEEEERVLEERRQQIRALAEREGRIVALTAELQKLRETTTAECTELRSSLDTVIQERDTLKKEMNALRVEHSLIEEQLTKDKEAVLEECSQVRQRMQAQSTEYAAAMQQLREAACAASAQLEEQRDVATTTLAEKEELARTSEANTRALERQLQSAVKRCDALQAALLARETDDRRNLTLLQLLNEQLSTSKVQYEEALDEERQRYQKLQMTVSSLESKSDKLQQTSQVITEERNTLRSTIDGNRVESEALLEQMKFDVEYLREELKLLKDERATQDIAREEAHSTLSEEVRTARSEADALREQSEEMEALLRRKDREYFDRITFLNAQLSNCRTVITQLQHKLESERSAHETQMKTARDDWTTVSRANDDLRVELLGAKAAALEIEAELRSDITILKASVFKLQAALVNKDAEMEANAVINEQEVHRLSSILDAHFIPHRSSTGKGENAEDDEEEKNAVVVALNGMRTKVAELTGKLVARNELAETTESLLKAQIANQSSVIENLQHDLLETEVQWQEKNSTLRGEIVRLQKTLDIHFIPYE